MKNQETRTLYSIACACGAKTTMDARSFGRPTVCSKCGKLFTVAWGKDPVTKRSIPVSVSLARKRPATPLQLVCTCGYKRAVTAAEAAKNTRCPGCGKSMMVEKPATPKSKDSNRIIKLSSAPVTLSKPQPMPKMPPVAPPPKTDESSASRLKRVPTSPAFAGPGLVCECGKALEVVKALGTDGTVCPACGREVRMEKIRNPQSKHTVIRPRFGPKTTAVPPPTPKPAPETVFEGPTAEFVEDPDPTPAPLASSYQELFCPCGEALMIGDEDAGKNIQCPTCLTLISVEIVRDAKTNHSGLRVKTIGKMDQDTWSLNDFA
jgi:hypothetical protein